MGWELREKRTFPFSYIVILTFCSNQSLKPGTDIEYEK